MPKRLLYAAEQEAEVYARLEPLQGDVIPKHHGVFVDEESESIVMVSWIMLERRWVRTSGSTRIRISSKLQLSLLTIEP